MTNTFLRTRILLFIYFVLSFILVLPGGHNALAQGNINTRLEGTFSDEVWTIRIDNKTESGTFLKVGNAAHKIGDRSLKIISRIDFKTWSASVYDKNYKSMQSGRIVIEANKLIITPDKSTSYVLIRVTKQDTLTRKVPEVQKTVLKHRSERTIITTPVSRSGSGCGAVQCHGITKKGYRCSRTTTNCSGYCWQH